MTVLKFQRNDESCTCPTCQLTEEYSEYIQEADSVDELKGIVRELIVESIAVGHREYLISDVESKLEMLGVTKEGIVYAEDNED